MALPMKEPLIFALGFIPCVFWLLILRRQDRHEPEPWLRILLVFIAGALSTYGVLWLRPELEIWLLGPGFPDETLWSVSAIDAYLVTALHEELWKGLAFVIIVLWHHDLDEPLDGLIYGGAAGLGFAAVENGYYQVFYREPETLVVRAFTATLCHVACTGVLGCALGMMRFSKPLAWPGWILGGVLAATFFHGTYDLFLFRQGPWIWLSLMVVLPTMLWRFAVRMHRMQARSVEFHPPTP